MKNSISQEDQLALKAGLIRACKKYGGKITTSVLHEFFPANSVHNKELCLLWRLGFQMSDWAILKDMDPENPPTYGPNRKAYLRLLRKQRKNRQNRGHGISVQRRRVRSMTKIPVNHSIEKVSNIDLLRSIICDDSIVEALVGNYSRITGSSVDGIWYRKVLLDLFRR